mgnify:CR=1 FL=1
MKYLLGIGIGDDPTFNATAKTISIGSNFNDKFADCPVAFVINNNTNTMIYKKDKTGLGGTWNAANSTLTLDASTSGMSNSDSLQVWLELGNKPGIEDVSNIYLKTMAIAVSDGLESKIDTMRSEQNTKLDKLAEVPDVTLIDTKTDLSGATADTAKDLVIVGSGSPKEAHIVLKDQTPSVGDPTKVADADLIVSAKGVSTDAVAVTIKEGTTVKVDGYTMNQADSIDSKADRIQVAGGGKIQVTLVKE